MDDKEKELEEWQNKQKREEQNLRAHEFKKRPYIYKLRESDYGRSWTATITIQALAEVEMYMDKEKLDFMNKQINEVLSLHTGMTYESRLVMEKALKLGYLMAHCRYPWEYEDPL